MKKRILCLLMCFIMMFVFSSPATALSWGLTGESIGDPNRDGVTDALDYLLVKRVVLGTISLEYISDNTYWSISAMNINNDTVIDSLDYAIYKRMVIGAYIIG